MNADAEQFETLNTYVEPFLTEYILSTMHDVHPFTHHSTTRRLICPSTWTPETFETYKEDILRFADGSALQYGTDWVGFRIRTDGSCTLGLKQVMSPIRLELVSFIQETFGWSDNESIDHLKTPEDIWYRYCYIRLFYRLNNTTVSRIRSIIRDYRYPENSEHTMIGYVAPFTPSPNGPFDIRENRSE